MPLASAPGRVPLVATGRAHVCAPLRNCTEQRFQSKTSHYESEYVEPVQRRGCQSS